MNCNGEPPARQQCSLHGPIWTNKEQCLQARLSKKQDTKIDMFSRYCRLKTRRHDILLFCFYPECQLLKLVSPFLRFVAAVNVVDATRHTTRHCLFSGLFLIFFKTSSTSNGSIYFTNMLAYHHCTINHMNARDTFIHTVLSWYSD